MPRIRVGIGGWTYEPWRGAFYPAGLPHKRELEYASRRLTSIEVNGTFYRTQTPETFAHWHAETPDDFVFALKGPRYATNRRVLAEAGDSVARFFASGVLELKEKLGPVNWQFAATKKFDPADFEGFLKLLPTRIDGRAIRHAVEVRHASFRAPEFAALVRAYGVAIVVAGDSQYPQIADVTADFVYARIMGTREEEPRGYSDAALREWADHARTWAGGSVPEGMQTAATDRPEHRERDVFLYVISGDKVRNPAAAQAVIARLGSPESEKVASLRLQ